LPCAAAVDLNLTGVVTSGAWTKNVIFCESAAGALDVPLRRIQGLFEL
jgi:hypothetical protein